MRLFFKYFFKLLPARFLPEMHKSVNGNRVELTEIEKRDRLEESTYNRSLYWLKKVNVPKKNMRDRNKRLAWENHYKVIGEVCVKFSSLEQQVKTYIRKIINDPVYDTAPAGTLIWEVLKEASKDSNLDDDAKTLLNDFIDLFTKITKDRFSILKCQYSYDETEKRIKAFNQTEMENIGKTSMSCPKDWDNFMAKVHQNFDENACRDLLERIAKCQQLLMKIQWHKFGEISIHDGKIYKLKGAKVGETIHGTPVMPKPPKKLKKLKKKK